MLSISVSAKARTMAAGTATAEGSQNELRTASRRHVGSSWPSTVAITTRCRSSTGTPAVREGSISTSRMDLLFSTPGAKRRLTVAMGADRRSAIRSASRRLQRHKAFERRNDSKRRQRPRRLGVEQGRGKPGNQHRCHDREDVHHVGCTSWFG